MLAATCLHACAASNHEKDTKLLEPWEMEYSTKRVTHPAMDEEGNVVEGSTESTVLIPKLLSVLGSAIEEVVMVVPEDPEVRPFLRNNRDDHSTRVILVRDRREHWALNFDKTVS